MAEILHVSVDINFPDGVARCATCPIFETYSRKQCRRTGEYITEDKTHGWWCPLETVNPETGQLEKLGGGWHE